MPNCSRIGSELDPQDLFALPPILCRSDWYGAPLSTPIEFYFALTPLHILFGASIPAPPRLLPGVMPQQFVEGLWESDVCELFLSREGTTQYQELNLGMQGAWWSCTFRGYRDRESSPPPTHVLTFTDTKNGLVRASLRVRRDELDVALDSSPGVTGNLCAIIGPSENRSYMSVHVPAQGKPDFHQQDCFQPLRFHDFNCASGRP